MPGLRFENHGSIWLATPLDEEAFAWLKEHTADDAQFWSRNLVIEPRYVPDIIHGAVEDGLEVSI